MVFRIASPKKVSKISKKKSTKKKLNASLFFSSKEKINASQKFKKMNKKKLKRSYGYQQKKQQSFTMLTRVVFEKPFVYCSGRHREDLSGQEKKKICKNYSCQSICNFLVLIISKSV